VTTWVLIAARLLVLVTMVTLALAVGRRRLRRAERLYTASVAQFHTVQNALSEAIQIYSPEGALISRNPAADRIFGLAGHELTRAALTSKWEFIGEDHSPIAEENSPLGRVMRTGVAVERLVVGIRERTEATVKWLSISTFPIRESGDRVTAYVSCAWDITEQTRTDREVQVLRHASERLSSSLVPDDVTHALTSAAAELCSPAGEQRRRAQLFLIDGPMLMVTGENDPDSPPGLEGGGLPIAEHPYIQRVIAMQQAVIAEFAYEEFGPIVAAALRRQEIRNCAWVPLNQNNRVFAVLAVAGRQRDLITGAQLQRLKALATMGELALRNAAAHAQVEELARTDPLTGLGNRRALDDRLRHLPRTRFALLALDVDDLKRVNDTHGHDAGDELLAKLAAVLAAELRAGDLLARTGGDEFVALLSDCDAAGAVELGHRLQRAAARISFAWGSASISVGSAAGAVGETPEEVAKAADRALYAAKEATKALPLAGSGAALVDQRRPR
jgi:diguanylate cyclase (GGDEF)-like protein/PAS domain S-box-containing protein